MARRKRECREYRCTEEPYLSGYCKQHHEERAAREASRDAAIRTLETGAIDGRLPDDLELREELMRIRERFVRARMVCMTQRGSKDMPLDEAEYAFEWCVSLAEAIREAELAHRLGSRDRGSLEYVRQWVWDRFRNLEAGLRSNGLPRSPSD